MIFLPLLLFISVSMLVSSRQRRAQQALETLTWTVRFITAAVLSNDLARLNAPTTTMAPACRFVGELARTHLYRGELCVGALRLLQQAVAAVREQQRLQGQLRMLFMTRVGGVIVFSLLGNFLLSHLMAAAPHSYLVPVVGSAVLLAGVWVLEKPYPRRGSGNSTSSARPDNTGPRPCSTVATTAFTRRSSNYNSARLRWAST